jgi:hypothetical protein
VPEVSKQLRTSVHRIRRCRHTLVKWEACSSITICVARKKATKHTS